MILRARCRKRPGILVGGGTQVRAHTKRRGQSCLALIARRDRYFSLRPEEDIYIYTYMKASGSRFVSGVLLPPPLVYDGLVTSALSNRV